MKTLQLLIVLSIFPIPVGMAQQDTFVRMTKSQALEAAVAESGLKRALQLMWMNGPKLSS